MILTLPLQSHDWKPASPPQPIQRPRVLVVDDDPLCRFVACRALNMAGYDTDTAEDGEAAWQILTENLDYDLVITDHNMPRMSGLELILKLHAARLSLPVILASGAVLTDELSSHPWLKIEAHLMKPFSSDELLETVEKALGRVSGVQEMQRSVAHC